MVGTEEIWGLDWEASSQLSELGCGYAGHAKAVRLGQERPMLREGDTRLLFYHHLVSWQQAHTPIPLAGQKKGTREKDLNR